MAIELKIPEVGESIQEVQIGQWLKQEGEQVDEDESLVELETDKASMELPAPAAGIIKQILKREGDFATVGEIIGIMEAADGEGDGVRQAQTGYAGDRDDDQVQGVESAERAPDQQRPEAAGSAGGQPASRHRGPSRQTHQVEPDQAETQSQEEQPAGARQHAGQVAVTPSARRALREHGLRPEEVQFQGTRLRRSDVQRFVEQHATPQEERASQPAPAAENSSGQQEADALEEVVPMSLIRRRIASRLVEAQQNAALLTTINEIDMSAILQLRRTHGERFQQRYGVKLGFMSFFVKAVIDALKQFPELNAQVRNGDSIVYRNYYHIGIAVGSGKGLVVPVVRHAERKSFAEIEQTIGDFARRAQDNKLTPDELQGGTFTISNGGVYGSLLSTPIVNPPQSGVLGMHAMQERPVARNGQVVIRPMMYVALTYDHRIVDGREAVTFLKRIKETVEEPSLMLIEV